jgi:hypothetical protein
MQKLNDLSRSLTPLKLDGTLIAVIEMSLSSWLVAGIVPGVERQPLKKLEADERTLLKLLDRWREEAKKSGHRIERIAVAFEAGRDGFWLARWLRARDIEAHIIHASSVAVSREHRRAKTDRLDTELLKRAFLGWLRGERDHRNGGKSELLNKRVGGNRHDNEVGKCRLCSLARILWLGRNRSYRLGAGPVRPRAAARRSAIAGTSAAVGFAATTAGHRTSHLVRGCP